MKGCSEMIEQMVKVYLYTLMDKFMNVCGKIINSKIMELKCGINDLLSILMKVKNRQSYI